MNRKMQLSEDPCEIIQSMLFFHLQVTQNRTVTHLLHFLWKLAALKYVSNRIQRQIRCGKHSFK